jgi:ribosomal protein S18 acetylase RimI-like enzyme
MPSGHFAPNPAVTIRPTTRDDAGGIARVFLETAEYHASLDGQRYAVPRIEKITERYRKGRQHPPGSRATAVTLVAEVRGEIVGFVDARLERSPDPMHRQLIYCQISEIAVGRRHRSNGIGGQLLRAAEEWGRGQGAEFALLEYLASNTPAARFYQQGMGYSVASITVIKRM